MNASLRRGLVASILYILLLWVLHFYLLAHAVLGLPLTALWEPFGLTASFTLLFGLYMHWAIGKSPPHRHIRILASIYLWSLCMVDLRYAAKLGVIEDSILLYAIATIGIALAYGFSYLF